MHSHDSLAGSSEMAQDAFRRIYTGLSKFTVTGMKWDRRVNAGTGRLASVVTPHRVNYQMLFLSEGNPPKVFMNTMSTVDSSSHL